MSLRESHDRGAESQLQVGPPRAAMDAGTSLEAAAAPQLPATQIPVGSADASSNVIEDAWMI